MQAIHGKDTSIELLLRKELYRRGYRYRKNVRSLPGSPDIVLTRPKIAIFCDGDFFHGYDLRKIESGLKRHASYWRSKIERNQERDRKDDEKLVALGYLVLHFWEHEIREDLNGVVNEIEEAVMRREEELPGKGEGHGF